jgi:hypothetical protein
MDADALFSVFDSSDSQAPRTGSKRTADVDASSLASAKRSRIDGETDRPTATATTTSSSITSAIGSTPSIVSGTPSATDVPVAVVSQMPATNTLGSSSTASSTASADTATSTTTSSKEVLAGEGPIQLGQEATEKETELIRDCIHEVAYPPGWGMSDIEALM